MYQVKVFVTGLHFHPNLLFESKAEIVDLSWALLLTMPLKVW